MAYFVGDNAASQQATPLGTISGCMIKCPYRNQDPMDEMMNGELILDFVVTSFTWPAGNCERARGPIIFTRA